MYKPKPPIDEHAQARTYAYAHRIPHSVIFFDGRHITQWFGKEPRYV